MIMTNSKTGKKKIPELLVPVGGKEQLLAAIASGADAVYFGGSSFNARMNAENFGENDIQEAVDLAHAYGVSVHVTLNTLIRDDEMQDALEYAKELYRTGVDALIVQDRGFASRVADMLPDFPLHMSTQGTISDIPGALEAVKAGFNRIILARELSGNEIGKIRRALPEAEIEIFVHGAICICYSGQCHLSDFIGGRSGNRGACAQPCRLPYELMRNGAVISDSEEPYLLSPADMCLVEHIDELCRMGIDSLKIEGRMKSPEYVASVTRIYRKYLDEFAAGREPVVDGLDKLELKSVFNRGNFTDAYFTGRSGRELMSPDTPKNKGVRIGTVRKLDVRNGQAEVQLTRELVLGDIVEIRSAKGQCGNIITYMRRGDAKVGYGKGRLRQDRKDLLRGAGAGDTVVIGDLRIRGTNVQNGDPVYKMVDSKLGDSLRASFSKLPQRVGVEASFTGTDGGEAVLEVRSVNESLRCGSVKVRCVSDQLLEHALKRPADEASVRKNLCKTGGTPYDIVNCHINIIGEPAIPAALINALRRQALDELTEARLDGLRRTTEDNSYAREETAVGFPETGHDRGTAVLMFHETEDLTVRVSQVMDLLHQREMNEKTLVQLFIPYKSVRRVSEIAVAAGYRPGAGASFELVARIPAVTEGSWGRLSPEESMPAELEDIADLLAGGFIAGVSLGHPSGLAFFEEIRKALRQQVLEGHIPPGRENFAIFMEESCNLYNSDAFRYWRGRGVSRAVVSHEFDVAAAADVLRTCGAGCEYTVYGRIPLMIMKHCPVGSGRCDGSKLLCRTGEYALRDRKGEHMPLICAPGEGCRCEILSWKPLDRIEEMRAYLRTGEKSDSGSNEAPGIPALRICIYRESANEIMNLLRRVETLITPSA